MNELESLQSIFKDRLFRIPDYQRGYAWKEKEQLQDFWDDLVRLPINKPHYTGVLTLKRVEESVWKNWNDERWLIEGRQYKPFHIVDGQQRLTTFVILIQAIYEFLQCLPENKGKGVEEIYLGTYSLKNIREEYIVIQKTPSPSIIRTYKFGYEADNPSFEFLKYRILGEPEGGRIEETFYTLNLEEAKHFFHDNLKDHLTKYGLEEVKILFKKATQNLKFNLYEISDDFDVFVAFETMNNRGKKLSTLELLKNRLIYLTTLYPENKLNPDDSFRLRTDINDAWREIYNQLGRNKNSPLDDDDFLFAHWIMYFQYTRHKGDDYKKFLLEKKFTAQSIYEKTEVKVSSIQDSEETRQGKTEQEEETEQNKVEDDDVAEKTVKLDELSPSEIQDYVNSLKSAAVHWYNTHNPTDNATDLKPDERLWIDRLNRIGIAYFRPLITASFISPNVDSSERVKLFKDIERFIFISFRMGRAFANYRSSEFYRAARELREGKTTVDEIGRDIEKRMKEYFSATSENSTEKYFNHSDFQRFIQKKFQNNAGGFYGWNGLRYFLYEYEWEKVKEKGNPKIDWELFVKGEKDKVSIEHIYPQTPNLECWKDAFKGFEKNKEFLSGTLGNLLPLSQSINSSLQNDCFVDKKNPKPNEKIRRGYKGGSHSEIEVAEYEDWNAQTILRRGLKLLTFMEKRWNLKFKDENAKKELLFLSFMNEEAER